MVNVISLSVVGGWQSAVENKGLAEVTGRPAGFGFGPVFNKLGDLLEWQRKNLFTGEK
jgi:hypothetical protein